MNKKNLMPPAVQPVHRIATGQLPSELPCELAELSEEALQVSLSSTSVLSSMKEMPGFCSYGGDDAE